MANVPNRWERAMKDSGFQSIRSLASEAGMSTTAVSDIITGLREPRPATRRKLMTVLKGRSGQPITEAEFHRLVTGRDEDYKPFDLPNGSETLSPLQREAVTKVVLAFLEDNRAAATDEKKTVAPGAGPGEKTNVAPIRGWRSKRDTSSMAARTTQRDKGKGED